MFQQEFGRLYKTTRSLGDEKVTMDPNEKSLCTIAPKLTHSKMQLAYSTMLGLPNSMRV